MISRKPSPLVDDNIRHETPQVAVRRYQPFSSEEDFLTACAVLLGFGRTIPVKYWDDWILAETDSLILKFGPHAAGLMMRARASRGWMRAIWSNIRKLESQNG